MAEAYTIWESPKKRIKDYECTTRYKCDYFEQEGKIQVTGPLQDCSFGNLQYFGPTRKAIIDPDSPAFSLLQEDKTKTLLWQPQAWVSIFQELSTF